MTLLPVIPVRPDPTALSPIVLLAHGSRDPRSARTLHGLAGAVSRRWAGGARAAFLDFNPPSVPAALRASAGDHPATVVPALLTHAHHGRVDVPAVVAASGVPARLTPVLGPVDPTERPDPLLVAALVRRLSELDLVTHSAGGGFDGLVLAAAGTSYASAQSTVDTVASALSSTMDVACRVGYATTSAPSVADAVAAVRATGANRIAVVAYFLAPGRLYDLVVEAGRRAGVAGVTAPLGAAEEIVQLILARAGA